MNFIPESKDFQPSGKLLISIPSEGCLGQRVVDQILSSNKELKFAGSFDHPCLQQMAGFVDDGRLVTCMELFYSEELKVGLIQIRAPPLKTEKFVTDFLHWFQSSGFAHIVASAGMQCSFPVPEVLVCGHQMDGESNDIPFIEKSFLQQSIRRAGFSKCLMKNSESSTLFLSADLMNLEPMVKSICRAVDIKYFDEMGIENLKLSDIPVGIF